jgi:hypothetical protein
VTTPGRALRLGYKFGMVMGRSGEAGKGGKMESPPEHFRKFTFKTYFYPSNNRYMNQIPPLTFL